MKKNKSKRAIHRDMDFSENPEFAKKCEEAGIVFIGPPMK